MLEGISHTNFVLCVWCKATGELYWLAATSTRLKQLSACKGEHESIHTRSELQYTTELAMTCTAASLSSVGHPTQSEAVLWPALVDASQLEDSGCDVQIWQRLAGKAVGEQMAPGSHLHPVICAHEDPVHQVSFVIGSSLQFYPPPILALHYLSSLATQLQNGILQYCAGINPSCCMCDNGLSHWNPILLLLWHI